MEKEKKIPNFTILLYGAAGSGKSIFASTFPKPLIIDADGGHKLYEKSFPDVVAYIHGSQAIAGLQKAIEQVQSNENKFQTIVIDSLTNLENMAIAQFKGMTTDNWSTNLYTNRGKALGYQDWGAISGSTIAILTELRKYPVNVVVITQMASTYSDGKEIFKPELVGKGQMESLHFADIVAYLEKVETVNGVGRLLHLSSTSADNFYAKARLLSGDHKAIENPSYGKLAKVIESDKLNLIF